MKSWKTFVCGTLALAGPLIAQFFPEIARYGHFLGALGAGLGLMFARDNNVTSEQAGAVPKPVEDPRQSKLGLILCLPLAALLLAGCGTLAKDGAYKGDTTIYAADSAIVAGYDTLHTFVTWEFDNQAALSVKPEIHAAAVKVRSNARQWVSTAIALRDAYRAAPSEENRAALERATSLLRAAVAEAAIYLTKG